jgi:hypothetical protein
LSSAASAGAAKARAAAATLIMAALRVNIGCSFTWMLFETAVIVAPLLRIEFVPEQARTMSCLGIST